MALEKPLITYRIENEVLVLGNAGKLCTNIAQFEKDNVLVTEEKLFFHNPASDRNVVKLLALEKFNAMRTKQNNLTGVESATRRSFSFKDVVEERIQSAGTRPKKQRADKQTQQWDLKEKEFYDLKSDWIQNVSYLKETGTKRWENMAQEFQGKWTDWRADFKAEHAANQALFLGKIEETVQKKETWTQNFLQQSQNNADEQSLRTMYDSIAGIVQSMQENLPQGVSLSVNVNDILASVLAKKPGSLSASLMDRASSIDTNFFLNEVKKYNFNDKGVKEQFQNLMEKTNVLSQNMVILQALESLRAMPETFVIAVNKQNEATQKSLDSTMAFGGFARMGAMYLRVIKNAAGGTEQQILPAYNDFVYTAPTSFPLVKDSNGNEWDLSKTDALLDGNKTAPSPSDISVMVRLAKNKMVSDFKKTLDNDAPHNYELENGLIDPTEAIGAFNDFTDSVMEGDSIACMNKTYEECSQAALGSATLVGEVPGGAYGLWQFGQFFPILKAKKEMDKRKAQMDASRNRRKTGIGRLYGQLGAIGEGVGQMLESGGKAYLNFMTGNLRLANGDVEGAKKDFKTGAKEGEKAVQGLAYAVSGFVDFLGTVVEIITDAVLSGLTFNLLNNDNTGLEGKYAEFNYELEKYRESNSYLSDLNRKGKMTQENMMKNERAISTVMTLTGQGATYEHLKGTYEGGGRGLMMETAEMGINMFLQKASAGTLSVNLGYNYNTGYSAGINVGPRMGQVGVAATLGYTEKTGTNVGVGIRGPGMNLMYQEGHTLDGHGNVIKTHGWSANVGGVGISHDSYSGYGMSFTASQGFALGGFAGGLSLSVGYNEKNGFSTSMDVDLEMLQGTNTWDPAKYNEIQNRQSQSSPFGNTPWDVVSNHFSNVFQGLGEAFKNGKFTNPFAEIANGVSSAWNSVSNFISNTYNKMFGNNSNPVPMLVVGRGGNKPQGFGLGDALPEGYSVSKGQTGWKAAYDGDGYTQKLKNGTINRITERDVDGEKMSYVNGQLLKHGDGLVMDSEGRLQVIGKQDLGKYIKDNNITNAVVSTNGIENSALDASQMFQAIARNVNSTDASQGGSGVVIHIFRDKKVSYLTSPKLDDLTVSSSLTDIINAGAFKTGGTILGHSAGGRTIQNGIMNSDETYIIKANVITFGGANNTALNARVASWTDIMHRQDKATGNFWPTKTYDPSIGNYKLIQTNFQSANGDAMSHGFLQTYNEEFLQYYSSNNRGY